MCLCLTGALKKSERLDSPLRARPAGGLRETGACQPREGAGTGAASLTSECAPPGAGADVDRVKREIEEIIGLDCSDALSCSAKKVRSADDVRALGGGVRHGPCERPAE